MTVSKLKKLAQSKKEFDKSWKKLSPKDRKKIEKEWDIEHAYYSSTMEGNGLDKKRFRELAKATS